MSFRNFIYLIRLGLKNVWNNKVYAAAAVMSMAACIFLFGIFYIAMVNINSAVRNVEKDVAVPIFFEERDFRRKSGGAGRRDTGTGRSDQYRTYFGRQRPGTASARTSLTVKN